MPYPLISTIACTAFLPVGRLERDAPLRPCAFIPRLLNAPPTETRDNAQCPPAPSDAPDDPPHSPPRPWRDRHKDPEDLFAKTDVQPLSITCKCCRPVFAFCRIDLCWCWDNAQRLPIRSKPTDARPAGPFAISIAPSVFAPMAAAPRSRYPPWLR